MFTDYLMLIKVFTSSLGLPRSARDDDTAQWSASPAWERKGEGKHTMTINEKIKTPLFSVKYVKLGKKRGFTVISTKNSKYADNHNKWEVYGFCATKIYNYL